MNSLFQIVSSLTKLNTLGLALKITLKVHLSKLCIQCWEACWKRINALFLLLIQVSLQIPSQTELL